MRTLGCSLFAMLGGLLALPVCAATQQPFDAVDAGRQALESRSGLPWYDADEDALRRIDVAPNEDDLKRHSQWAASDIATGRRQWSWSGAGIFWSIMRVLAWVGLGLLAAAVIWAIVWAATRIERRATDRTAEEGEVASVRSRIEDLPMPVSPQFTDLLAAARACFEAGDLKTAIIYAFAHQLVELDKHHLIQLTRGKTNRQYLRELRAQPRFIALLTPTMLAFEDVFFGHHEMTRQRFQACWEDLDRFHQQLEQVAL